MSPRILSTLAFVFLLNTASAAPLWIWLTKDATKDKDVTFRHRFEIPANAHFATLELTCGAAPAEVSADDQPELRAVSATYGPRQ